MSEAAIIYASDTPLSSGTDIAVSAPFQLGSLGCSFQICYDGGSDLYYQVQTTNLPVTLPDELLKVFDTTNRDDSYASPMWRTIANGNTVSGNGAGVELVIYPQPTFAYARVLLQHISANAPGAQSYVAVLALVGG